MPVRSAAARIAAWRLGEDDLRHAIFTPGAVRGACGRRVRAERFDRGDRPRCTTCQATLEGTR